MKGLFATVVGSAILTLMALVPQPAAAQQWQLLDGAAYDIGIGANGTVWIIGRGPVPGGYEIWRRDGSSWSKIAGGAVRVAVDPAGNAWVVNSTGAIFRYDGRQWVGVPGAAHDVGVGADGSVWIIGRNAVPGGYGIYRWNGGGWTNIPGGAVRVAVDSGGNAWIVNSTNTIFRHTGSAWQTLPGSAKDVGAGPAGAVWITGADGGIYRWNGSNWDRRTGGATDIAVAPDGNAWVVNSAGQIFRSVDAPVAAAVRRIFPRGGTYEVQMLRALRYLRYNNMVYANGQLPAAGSLSPLDLGFAQLGLLAAEAYYATNPTITADQVIAAVNSYDNPAARRAVTGYLGFLLIGKMFDTNRDPVTVALRQWSTDLYRNFRITTAKAALDEYARWKNDPCGYEGRPAGECSGIVELFTTRKPPEHLFAKNAMGSALTNDYSGVVAAGTAVAATAATAVGASVALASALGTVVVPGTVTSGGVVIGQVATSLFAAFGGQGGAAAGSAGAIGAAGWAGVVAAPVAAAVLAVVVGTLEGFKVVEAARVEPMLKLKLGAAMTENIVIENALSDANAASFFFMAYERSALAYEKPPAAFVPGAAPGVVPVGFEVPQHNVDGEVRFFCQAGYVSRFKLTYMSGGQRVTKQTANLSVGYEETFPIPARATDVVASGEWFDGINWKPLFTRNLPGPTYIGFTSYGTVFSPQFKDEYPEISNIIARPNELTITHGGGYVAWIRVRYQRPSGAVTAVDESGTTAGWRRVFTIPADATNIRVEAWTKTGLVWEPWKTIIDTTYPSPPNVCLKFFGTTLDPKVNNECR